MRNRAKSFVLVIGAASLCGALFVYAQGQAPAGAAGGQAGGAAATAGGQAAGAGISGAAVAAPVGAVAAAGAALAGAAARSASATVHASPVAHARKAKACQKSGGKAAFC